LAPFREADRRALFLPEDLLREPFRALLRAEPRPPFLADFLALFLADFLADFFAPFREEDFLAAPRLDFLADLRLGWAGLVRALAGDSSNSYGAGVEAGVGAGVCSIGSGSIQPEPDQPISM
jgi:hypothetical protein